MTSKIISGLRQMLSVWLSGHGQYTTTRRFKILVRLCDAAEWSARPAKYERDKSKEGAANCGQVGSCNAWAGDRSANAKGDCRAIPRHHWATPCFPYSARILRFMGCA